MRRISVNKESLLYILSATVMVICSFSTMSINASLGRFFLGPDSVAVVNLVMPVSEFYYVFVLLFGIPSAIVASYESGKGNTEAVSRHFTVSFTLVLFFTLLFTLFLLIFSNPVSRFLTADVSLQAQTDTCLSMMLPWFVIHNLFLIMEIFTLIIGKIRYVLICSLVQFGVNILCGVLLANTWEWGEGSFAISSAVSVELAAILLVIFHFRNDWELALISLSFTQFVSTMRSGIKYGLAFFLTQAIYVIFAYLVNNIVFGYYGEDVMLCWSVLGIIFTLANYASVSGQLTCILLGGRHYHDGKDEMFFGVFRDSCVFVVVWNVLVMLSAYLISLFYAGFPTPPYVILICTPFFIINNVMGVYSLKLLFNGRIGSFVWLFAVIYLPLPFLFWLFHKFLPGYEMYSVVAMIPIQALEYLVVCKK